ncbi:MAG TPA: biotin/lipoyl-containing protein, partial [Thermoanaerobaculia bacterium]|nr:biotin/lipoyl-containing protein [Thermoanaerobaculia bacterium]
MPTEVVMPQMGESIAEGTITKWLVKVGDKVERDQPLFEISTDKVDAEIPSPAAGVLLEVRNKEGETVPVNQVVALIGAEGEAGKAEGETGKAAEPPAAAPKEEAPKEAPKEEAPAAAAEAAPAPASPEPAPAPAADGEEKPEAEAKPAAEAEVKPGSEEERLRKFSSPLVRSIAAKEGVDIGQVEGTGAQGRVTKQDILTFIDQRQKPAAA